MVNEAKGRAPILCNHKFWSSTISKWRIKSSY